VLIRQLISPKAKTGEGILFSEGQWRIHNTATHSAIPISKNPKAITANNAE